MKPDDKLEAFDGDFDIFQAGDLLDGEIIPDSSGAVPNESLYINHGKFVEKVLKQVVEGFLQDQRRTKVGGDLLFIARCCSLELLDHSLLKDHSFPFLAEYGIRVVLVFPNVAFVDSRHSFKLGAHVLAFADEGYSLVEGPRLIRVLHLANGYVSAALDFAISLELYRAETVSRRRWGR